MVDKIAEAEFCELLSELGTETGNNNGQKDGNNIRRESEYTNVIMSNHDSYRFSQGSELFRDS